MAGKKSSFFNMLIALTLVTLTASFALGYVYELTKGPIAQAKLERQLRAIQSVVEAYDNNPVEEQFEVNTETGFPNIVFPATEGGERKGAAISARSMEGYSGEIIVMVGFTPQGLVNKAVVLEHKETPGLGSKMTQPRFADQFLGIDPSKGIALKDDGGTIDAISGATISSEAYIQAVQSAYDSYKEAYGNEGN